MRRVVWAPVLAVLLLVCGTAWAAPTTVNLRVEGATSTIFEGPVTTDGKTIVKDGNTIACDGTTNPGNPGPGPTVLSALDDAPIPGGWDGKFGGEFVSRIGSEPGTDTQSWGIVLNHRPLAVSGCQQQVTTGDEVLFAFDYFMPVTFAERPTLQLSGPAKATTGQPMTVGVQEFELVYAPFPEPREFRQGPAAGAVVEGTATGPDGTTTVTFGSPGLKRLKAERFGSVRSNGLLVCVSDAGTDSCGIAPPAQKVRDSAAPTVRIAGPRNGRRYRHGPRLLRGVASDQGSGVKLVKLALRRHVRGKGCQWWSGRREKFVGRNCRKKFFFGITANANWSYLLPRALGPGHYVLDVKAIDAAGNRAPAFRRGVNRTVFDVVGPKRRPTASAAAAGARVQVMVVGQKKVIAKAVTVRARATKVRASGRRCAVGASTPLAALAAALGRAKVGYAVRDFGTCTADSPRDSGQLFVNRIGKERNGGQDGWVYKIDDRAPGRGAADARLRRGDRVVWLYCRQDLETGGCQRSLRALPAKRVGRVGDSLKVTVFGYDDKGARRAIPGALVTLRGGKEKIATATTLADGTALMIFPIVGPYDVSATADGLVPSFPVRIRAR